MPAIASAPFIKEIGPDAFPFLEIGSNEDLIFERFTPAPDPPEKINISVLYHSAIDSLLSRTSKIKQAEHCGFSSMPKLNHTGELNEPFWFTRMHLSSSLKIWESFSVTKYPEVFPQPVTVSATRFISCFTLDSLPSLPKWPEKYFSETISVAVCDQKLGTSTPFCSKTISPLEFLITAFLFSHLISSKGCAPSLVKNLFKDKPLPLAEEIPSRDLVKTSGDIVS